MSSGALLPLTHALVHTAELIPRMQGVDLDNWIEKVRKCQYLQEDELKALCEYVRLLCCCGCYISSQASDVTLCPDKGDIGRGVKCAAREQSCHRKLQVIVTSDTHWADCIWHTLRQIS